MTISAMRLAILSGLILAACGSNDQSDAERLRLENRSLAAKSAVKNRLGRDRSIARVNAPSLPRSGSPMDDGPSPDFESRHLPDEDGTLCWEDYCPCEPDPDNTATETMHCDLFRIGEPRPDQELVLAEALRNARREQRQWHADNPGY